MNVEFRVRQILLVLGISLALIVSGCNTVSIAAGLEIPFDSQEAQALWDKARQAAPLDAQQLNISQARVIKSGDGYTFFVPYLGFQAFITAQFTNEGALYILTKTEIVGNQLYLVDLSSGLRVGLGTLERQDQYINGMISFFTQLFKLGQPSPQSCPECDGKRYEAAATLSEFVAASYTVWRAQLGLITCLAGPGSCALAVAGLLASAYWGARAAKSAKKAQDEYLLCLEKYNCQY